MGEGTWGATLLGKDGINAISPRSISQGREKYAQAAELWNQKEAELAA